MSEKRRSFREDPSLAAGLLFGLLGFAGNWLDAPLFSEVDFLFGSFFVMIAVVRYGAWTGFIASLIASVCTVVLWKHPWAMVILLAETAFIGWRIQRRGRSTLLEYDIIFWCCCGVPLIWILYCVVGGETAAFTKLIAAKQFVNGIFNALFASIFQLIFRKTRSDDLSELPTLNQIVFTVMVSLVLIPALIYIVQDIRQSLREKAEVLSQDTARACTVSREVLTLWLNDHHQVIQTLARQVGNPNALSRKEMQRTVEAIQATTPAFSRMGILNRHAITVAYSPLWDDLGRSTLGVDYSHRPYLKNLQQARGSKLGDVFIGRIGKPAPIVAMVTPLTVNGQNEGVAVGIIRVEEIKKYLEGIAGSRAVSITILDRLDQVVASTRGDLPIKTLFKRKAGGTVVQAGHGVTHWTPAPEVGSMLKRWSGSLYIKEAILSPETPWKVVVESSYAPVLLALQSKSTFSLSMLALLILIIVPLSQVICSRLTADLATLRKETRRLPKLVREGVAVILPNSRIQEVTGLIENFRETCTALGQQYQTLDHLNNKLEKRVREAETRFKTMFEKHTAVMLLIEPKTVTILDANRTAALFYGYSLQSLRGMALSEINCMPRQELEALKERIAAGEENVFVAPHRLASGEVRTVEVYAAAITVGTERVIFSIIIDITDRKLAEKGLADYRDNLEQQVLARTASLSLSNKQLEQEIEERKRTEQQLLAHQQKLSDLAIELSLAEERERNRIAGELHDQVGQRLLLGKMKLEVLANRLPNGVRERDVTEIRTLLEQTLKDIRSLTFQIRPPLLATAGLESAIQWLGEELQEDFGLQLEYLDDHQPKPLSYEVRSVVFQAVRELLLNVVKHAGTKKARVSLEREAGFIMISVADDGIGIDNTTNQHNRDGGFGLFNVQQRIAYLGGELILESLPGKGTRIAITVPLDQSATT